MKAEDFLHSKEIYQATCLTNKATYYLKDLVILLDDYARIQIEKDRGRIKKSVMVKANIEGNELDVASYETYEGCKFTVSIESIDSTPINLD